MVFILYQISMWIDKKINQKTQIHSFRFFKRINIEYLVICISQAWTPNIVDNSNGTSITTQWNCHIFSSFLHVNITSTHRKSTKRHKIIEGLGIVQFPIGQIVRIPKKRNVIKISWNSIAGATKEVRPYGSSRKQYRYPSRCYSLRQGCLEKIAILLVCKTFPRASQIGTRLNFKNNQKIYFKQTSSNCISQCSVNCYNLRWTVNSTANFHRGAYSIGKKMRGRIMNHVCICNGLNAIWVDSWRRNRVLINTNDGIGIPLISEFILNKAQKGWFTYRTDNTYTYEMTGNVQGNSQKKERGNQYVEVIHQFIITDCLNYIYIKQPVILRYSLLIPMLCNQNGCSSLVI